MSPLGILDGSLLQPFLHSITFTCSPGVIRYPCYLRYREKNVPVGINSYFNNNNNNNNNNRDEAKGVRSIHEPRVVLANYKTGCSIFLSMNISLGDRQWRHVALCHGAFCVSRQHRLCRRWPGRTFTLYSFRADVFIRRLWNNIYDQWITSNFLCK